MSRRTPRNFRGLQDRCSLDQLKSVVQPDAGWRLPELKSDDVASVNSANSETAAVVFRITNR